MPCRIPAAAAAALSLVAFAALTPPAGAGPLTTRDGRCALWNGAETEARPGDRATWDGGCRDGLGEGFGIHDLTRTDGSRLRYIGPVRAGRWHGLGRLQHVAPDGGLLQVVEGVFVDGAEQGVFQELVFEHPQNVPLGALRPPGQLLGQTAVRIQQFYTDGAAVLMCAPGADCVREAVAAGIEPRPPARSEAPDRVLPSGGWRLERRPGDPAQRSYVCLDPSLGAPGQAPRVDALLFPSFSAWEPWLREGHRCEDLSISRQGDELRWTSQCRHPDRAGYVQITLRRTVAGNAVRSRTDEAAVRDGREPVRRTRDVSASFVGACRPDMARTPDADVITR